MAEPKLRVRASGMGGSGYAIPTRPQTDGKPLRVPGVTTVLKVVDKPALIQWAANQTAAAAVTDLEYLHTVSEEQGFKVLQYAHNRKPRENDRLRLAHKFVLNDAAELGTNIHEWVEAYMTGTPLPVLETQDAEEMAVEFADWESSNTVEVIHTEATVFNSEHNYAGTLDGIWRINGVDTIVDLKSSRNTWPEHRMQLSALKKSDVLMVETDEWDVNSFEYINTKKEKTYWKEAPMPNIEAAMLLHVRPSDIDSKGNWMDSFCTPKYVEIEDLDVYHKGFVASLNMAQAIYIDMKPLDAKYK